MTELLDSVWPWFVLVLGGGAMPYLAWRVADRRERPLRAAQLAGVGLAFAVALAHWSMQHNQRDFSWNFGVALLTCAVWAVLLVPAMVRPAHSPFSPNRAAEQRAEAEEAAQRVADAADAVKTLIAIVEEDEAPEAAAAAVAARREAAAQAVAAIAEIVESDEEPMLTMMVSLPPAPTPTPAPRATPAPVATPVPVASPIATPAPVAPLAAAATPAPTPARLVALAAPLPSAEREPGEATPPLVLT